MGELGGGNRYRVYFWDDENTLKLLLRLLHNFVKTPRTVEWYILSSSIVWYVGYISVKLLTKNKHITHIHIHRLKWRSARKCMRHFLCQQHLGLGSGFFFIGFCFETLKPWATWKNSPLNILYPSPRFTRFCHVCQFWFYFYSTTHMINTWHFFLWEALPKQGCCST